ncbi:MAG: sugar ABC transporter ATP-binding protein [Desulfotignum sp.]|nr:sugar ABC transporter ATP-binding protein [Desulfotignum sp.]
MTPIIEARKISKEFPGMLALDRVDFDLLPGEIHTIAGENGAGKSTLMHCLAGVYQPSQGTVLVEGTPVRLRNPHHSQEYGISTVFQEMALAPNMSVAENVYTNAQPSNRFGLINYEKMYQDTISALEIFGVDIDPGTPLKNYSVAVQQIVEIARAIEKKARVLILDEPTSAIGRSETAKLLEILKMLKSRGVGIIYISHKLNEVFAISDRITVLKDGRRVKTLHTKETNPDEVVELMIGRELSAMLPARNTHAPPTPFVSLYNLSGEGFSNVSLEINANEILGIFGLTGSGRSELARGIFGVDPLHSGTLSFNGSHTAISTPYQAISKGIAYIPEDRKQDGLFLDMSIRENISAACLKELSGNIFMDPSREIRLSEQAATDLGIKATGIDQPVGMLSGGNQQKVLFAKWLARKPSMLIADEPTRGVDIGAKAEIHLLLRKLADQGAAVVMISSELPEILGMSDRIAVMREGKLVALLDRSQATEEVVASHALGTGKPQLQKQ